MERVFILDCHVNVASDMWNLGFKGLLHILMSPILLFFFTVQPVHTGPCANRNPVYTVIIIWSRINYTQNNTN